MTVKSVPELSIVVEIMEVGEEIVENLRSIIQGQKFYSTPTQSLIFFLAQKPFFPP